MPPREQFERVVESGWMQRVCQESRTGTGWLWVVVDSERGWK